MKSRRWPMTKSLILELQVRSCPVGLQSGEAGTSGALDWYAGLLIRGRHDSHVLNVSLPLIHLQRIRPPISKVISTSFIPYNSKCSTSTPTTVFMIKQCSENLKIHDSEYLLIRAARAVLGALLGTQVPECINTVIVTGH
uniref:Uncharacterized protein n=1 Tax=Picea sitchensis TaxID=3332 RepID=D5A8S7_PICSI|nr:unknown [Picea sitchensis]